MTTVPKDEIEILNQEIDEETGSYRIRAGHRVHYLTIGNNVFDDDTMCRPYLLIPQLPKFPDYDWTKMNICKSTETGEVQMTISSEPLAEICETWHPLRVDVLSLRRKTRLQSGVHEVEYEGKSAVAKIACFEWTIAGIERETCAYRILAEHRRPEEAPFAPKFLAHLTENGRVIGLLMDKVEGTCAGIDDLESCRSLVRRLHSLGLIHGDVNRFNFVVDRRSGGMVVMVDFEHAEAYSEDAARLELESLESELIEDSGRGQPFTL